ncbi:MAG: SPOR domain-containing protein [Bacteroidota bacterium]|nr:SPOR domain-containing protein [Bacteroidota bacterium]MDP3145799.1 SPOR domain-containing protein [Bacteroidota bacterium]MDP3558433.1 SPOR domain-containing protein [Bacteroidota bacterium]
MNVQQTIIKGIKEQLFFHNYLVLPNFGGFVLKASPTHFSNSGALLTPPSKTLSFNSQLKQNDGILALWLQNQTQCTSSEALSSLNEFADYCKTILSARRRLSIEGIGFFYLDFENNTCFEPQLETNFLADSFGLKPITLIELSEPSPRIEVKKEVVFENRIGNDEININTELKKQRNFRRVIAPLAILIAIFSLLSLLVTNTKISGKLKSAIYGTNDVASYSPLNYSDLTLTVSDKENTGYVTDANGVANIELENNKTLAVKVIETAETSVLVKDSHIAHKVFTHKSSNFEVVLGVFSVLDNAERMMKKLKRQNVNAVISEQNSKGMYVVSNGDFQTKEQAILNLEKISDVCPNAWVKKPGNY